jgi:FkbM family methyltransferase
MNKGEFSRWIVAHSGAQCFGAEPAPELFAALPLNERIRARRVAIAGAAGETRLIIPEGACAALSHTGVASGGREIAVQAITLAALLDGFGVSAIDLLKIDIEGAEIEVLASLTDERLARIDQMTIEFHDFFKPSDAPPVRRALWRLAGQGFYVVNFGRKHFTDVLCLNRRRYRIDAATRLQLHATKYWRGATRLARSASRRALSAGSAA